MRNSEPVGWNTLCRSLGVCAEVIRPQVWRLGDQWHPPESMIADLKAAMQTLEPRGAAEGDGGLSEVITSLLIVHAAMIIWGPLPDGVDDDVRKDDIEYVNAGPRYLNAVWQSARATSGGVTLFTTLAGYAGLGPASVKDGDILVMARNTRLLLILRRESEGYSFRGTAYLNECTNDRVFRNWDDVADIEEQTFAIH